MLPLGTEAPNFKLLDTISNTLSSLEDLKGKKGTVVMFICNHCPFVKHVNEELVRLCNDYRVTGFGFVAISSNDVENYPQDSPEQMRKTAREQGYPFPYLYDPSQEVAKAYDAACTPDFYLFDENLSLVYRGRFDDSRPGNEVPVTGKDLHQAAMLMLSKKAQYTPQYPSMGCNIKWHLGNSPEEKN